MSFVDLPDVFVGSTDDAHTFVVFNRPRHGADHILTDAGFTAREHNGRTIYLIPPGIPQDANERAVWALHGLLVGNKEFVDLSWTTYRDPHGPLPGSHLCFRFADGTVTATAETDTARWILEQHGFTPSPDGSYLPPSGLDELGLLDAVEYAHLHAYIEGLGSRVDLGIPTPDAIPIAPRQKPARAQAASPGPVPAPGNTGRRHR
ncbi:hypothetical protein ABR737_33195 [Streptomyces sp. Edi2]|uniref:hypothetical protein n=1 Tax=Streptomyces sp. Edi2 TaxID=3162528 RepID=UPI0033056BE5